MATKEKLATSVAVASIFTLVDVAHRKYGGTLSGGRYSDSHTWQEMKAFIPEFIGFFLIFFVGMLVYLFIIKNEESYMCPTCFEPFTMRKVLDPKCPKCSSNAEVLAGFYHRHPEQKEDPANKQGTSDT